MSSAPTPDVRRILSRLGRLRARIRALFATIGVSRWVLFTIGVLALFFLADWLLDLPLGVRRFVRLGFADRPAAVTWLVWLPVTALLLFLAVAFTRRGHRAAPLFAFLAGGCAGLLVWRAARALRPLSAQLADDDLALSVESRYRHLRDRLAAALDFDRELRTPSRGESAAMMQAVVGEAAEEARKLDFSRAVSGRKALRWSGAALAALLAVIGAQSVFGAEVGLWARRSLLLEDVAWPRATTMVAVDAQPDGSFVEHDPAVAYQIPIGRSLTIYARADGRAPDGAQVLDLVDEQEPLARRMFGVPGHDDVFAYEFLDVRRPFAFLLRGGDDEDDIPAYRVEITIPPRVLSIRSTVTYPAYLDRAPETFPDASLSLPQGARVRVEFDTDLPIARATVALGDDSLPAAPVEGSATRFAFEYEADRTVSGRVLLRTADGKENDPAADSFDVRVQIDQPPRVDWIWPRRRLQSSPIGRAPLLAECTDDHGVAELTLEFLVGSGEPVRVPLTPYMTDTVNDAAIPSATTDGAYGRRRVLAYVPVELVRLTRLTAEGELVPLEAQDTVLFRLTAKDLRGQVREGDWAHVDLRTPTTIERELSQQRTNVRLSVESLAREQSTRRDDVKALLSSSIGDAERDLLKTVRFAQGRIAQDADRAIQELLTVFNAFVYARLGAEGPNTRILSILDRHHRATYGLDSARSLEPSLQPAKGSDEWKGDPVFPYALYDEIVVAWRADLIFDQGLLDKMLAAVASAIEVGARLAPAAHRTAAEALGGERERIQALALAQEANLTAIQQLLDSMQGWQSLHDLKMKLREIIEEQELLIRRQVEQGEKKDTEAKDGGSGR